MRFEDWDDSIVDLSRLRLLPINKLLGKDSKKSRDASSATKLSKEASIGKDSSTPQEVPDDILKSMLVFVQSARDQLLLKHPEVFERLTQLLAHYTEPQRVHDAQHVSNAPPSDSDMNALLEPFPQLRVQLEAILSSVPAAPSQGKKEPENEPTLSPDDDNSVEDLPIDGTKLESVQVKNSHSDDAASEENSIGEAFAHSSVNKDSDAECYTKSSKTSELSNGKEVSQSNERMPLPSSSGSALATSEGVQKSKGARELQKLLDEFGGGATVGVDGSRRRVSARP